MVKRFHMSIERFGERLIPLLAASWLLLVVVLELVAAIIPDWLSWTSTGTDTVTVSAPPASRPDGCVTMANGIEVCDDPMPPRR